MRPGLRAPALGAALLLAGCGDRPPPAPATELTARIDRALAAAADYLVRRQSPEGAWRSEIYGVFRDGPTLTPYVSSAVFFLGQGGDASRGAFRRAALYLARPEEMKSLPMPVYTAAAASWVEGMAGNLPARDAWLVRLRGLQLVGSLGWSRDDPGFGGWGYSVEVPRKGSTPASSNLSATVFAIGALRSAQVPSSDPAWRDALEFAQRCQNFSSPGQEADPRFDDGGFYFSPADAALNKAGSAGRDRTGRTRFHSYGSATADGVRALLQCGLSPDHPRVVAASRWLTRHFTPNHNPGSFNTDREVLLDGTYYYWCWSAAHAFSRMGGEREPDWAEALARELMRRQRTDGSWVNRFTDSKEDDPLVATPAAAAALALCRRRLEEKGAGHEFQLNGSIERSAERGRRRGKPALPAKTPTRSMGRGPDGVGARSAGTAGGDQGDLKTSNRHESPRSHEVVVVGGVERGEVRRRVVTRCQDATLRSARSKGFGTSMEKKRLAA